MEIDRAASTATARQAAGPGESLADVTRDAFAWRLLTEVSRLALVACVQIILARLLPVEAFGVLAMAMVVVSLGSQIAEIGTGPALIRRQAITDVHVRVAFWLAVTMGALLSAAVWLAAPAAAAVFDAPQIVPVLQTVGLVFVAGGFGTTADALIQRAMDYRRLVSVEVISYAIGFIVVGLSGAALGYGVWALVWATVAQAAARSVLLIGARPHPMRPCFAPAEARQLLHFGLGISLSRLTGFAAQNADSLVVARWLGASALGLYSRAGQLMSVPINQFSSILNVVLFPAYSSIQSDDGRLRRGYLASLSLSSMVVFPVLTTTALTAPEVMGGIFGPSWVGAAVPLRILCLGGAGYCIYNLADSLVRAKGALYTKALNHAIHAVAVLVAALVGQRWGLVGVSAGMVAAMAVVYLLMARLSLRLVGCSWRRFFLAQRPGMVISCAAAAAGLPVLLGLRSLEAPSLLALAATGSASMTAAIAAAFSLPRRWLPDQAVALLDQMTDKAFRSDPGLPRWVDVAIALTLLVVSAPVLGAIALTIAVTSRGPVLFRHARAGRHGRAFQILKFRSMRIGEGGPEVTASDDPRITALGRYLRKSKLDELPALWNVIRGDMALVGPRPEALHYIGSTPDWQRVLSVRPGLTDPVTIRLRNEEELLAGAGIDREEFYCHYLLPYKVKASAEYLAGRTWRRDVDVLWRTFVAVMAPSRIAPLPPSEIVARVLP